MLGVHREMTTEGSRAGGDRCRLAGMRAVWTLGIVLLASCSATPEIEGSGGAAGSAGEAGTATDGGAGSGGQGATGGEGGVGGFGGQAGGIPVGETEVFGHSPVTLYRLDPVTKEVTTVGDFDG